MAFQQQRRDKGVKSDFWVRVEDLERTTGLPRGLAQQVAAGQLTVNQALEKLAFQDKVERLMKKHELGRALATQVALGHTDLEQVLRKHRMTRHKQENYARSILDEMLESGEVRCFALHGGRTFSGRVVGLDRYEAQLRSKDAKGAGDPVVEHKLQFKYAYQLKDAKRVKRSLRFDRALKDEPREPILRPQDRYTCSDRRLFGYVDNQTSVVVTTLEGELFRGEIQWMSRYEFSLKLKGGVEIVVFRHALSDISEK